MSKKMVSLDIKFSNVSLPPFEDILLVTHDSPYGRLGVSGSMNLLQPDKFELLEMENDLVEAILVNKRILKRLSVEKVIEVLEERVIPFIVKGEIVQVDFKITVGYSNVKIEGFD